MLAEALHRQVALLLREVSVEGVGVVTVLNQFVGNLLRLHACATKNDGIDFRVVINDTFEGEVFVARAYHIIYMIDVLGAFVTTTHDNLSGIVEIILGDALNLFAHCGREEERSVIGGYTFKDGVNAL